MKQQHMFSTRPGAWFGTLSAGLAAILFSTAMGNVIAAPAGKAAAPATPAPVVAEERSAGGVIAAPLRAVVGKSSLIQLQDSASRLAVGNPSVADVSLINPREVYVLGKGLGTTNLMVWTRGGGVAIYDITVTIDTGALQDKLREVMPNEKNIAVTTAADSVVLSGTVSDVGKVDRAVSIAEAYVRNINRSLVLPVTAGDAKVQSGTSISVGGGSGGGAVRDAGARVVNLLQVTDAQQVLLEVKVAEVSRTLLDKLGADFAMSRTNGAWNYRILGDFLTDSAGFATAFKNSLKQFSIDAEKKDGLVKILAEPNIMAISGQKGSFLAGGKIFIPIARNNDATGGSTITLEEKEFGIGLAFTPTVLDAGRINLVVAPEVSELSQTGSPFTTVGGVTSVLPSFTVRRASTTVQLSDGQSFAIAGLIKNNVTETVRAFPILGELPIIGALFRSSEFQSDKTELLFVVTPRLVKPLPPNYALPTDSFTPPSRPGFFLGGKMEGGAQENKEGAAEKPQQPASSGGFEVK